ncbi:Crp/Fnr family transcriptional regulator [Aureivirga marina]|uniref:Crp/Fnr family transcriptional regulator n=1 Tax=Aureivirga marina TaxID=1182451 RepID=UPI0018CA66A6|nr:Crp/Fnr family transcriptional regulator [Aureivirga marina]
MEELEEYLIQNFDVSKNEIDNVLEKFQLIEIKKNEYLLRSGDICEYIYFVVSGCLRTFFYNSEGFDSTRYIAFENNFIGPLHSFIQQIPSNENISAVEQSKVLRISHRDFKEGMNSIPVIKDLYIQFLEKAYIMNYWRIETFLSLDAKERYVYLFNNNKLMIKRLPNKILASFIGIAPESLSRIKSKI